MDFRRNFQKCPVVPANFVSVLCLERCPIDAELKVRVDIDTQGAVNERRQIAVPLRLAGIASARP